MRSEGDNKTANGGVEGVEEWRRRGGLQGVPHEDD